MYIVQIATMLGFSILCGITLVLAVGALCNITEKRKAIHRIIEMILLTIVAVSVTAVAHSTIHYSPGILMSDVFVATYKGTGLVFCLAISGPLVMVVSIFLYVGTVIVGGILYPIARLFEAILTLNKLKWASNGLRKGWVFLTDVVTLDNSNCWVKSCYLIGATPLLLVILFKLPFALLLGLVAWSFFLLTVYFCTKAYAEFSFGLGSWANSKKSTPVPLLLV